MEMSPTGDMCYTGGHDGVICCWSVPSVTTELYDPFGMVKFTFFKSLCLGQTDEAEGFM